MTMKITLELTTVADEAARLVMRGAVAADLDPLHELRAVPVDAESVGRVAASVGASVVALLGCYYDGMTVYSDRWVISLWSPAWFRRVDRTAVEAKMLRLMSLAVAARLLMAGPLSATAETYHRQATDEVRELVSLLDTLTLAPVPAPGRIRRPLHPPG